MSGRTDVVVIGAGPYGLSLGAHLHQLGFNFRIFGRPMSVWREHMPKGMFLKSDGFASNLSEPASRFTYRRYCERTGIPYHDTLVPVPLDTFTAYADDFQKRCVPDLEDTLVRSIERTGTSFRVSLETDEVVETGRVVFAVGISYFSFIPPVLNTIPSEFLSHSYFCSDPQRFRGKEVTIIGAGASAMDLCAALHESGASVTVVARRPAVRFNLPWAPGPRSLWERVRYPMSGLGPGTTGTVVRSFAGSGSLFSSESET